MSLYQWGTLTCHAQAWKEPAQAACFSSMLTGQSWVSSPKKLFCLFQLSQPQLFTKLNKEPFIDTRPLSAHLPEQSATGSQSSGHRPLPPTLLHSSRLLQLNSDTGGGNTGDKSWLVFPCGGGQEGEVGVPAVLALP